MFESWAIDLKYALRRLRQRPTYTALTVLTLALGIAGTAAVAGISRQLLLEPLPIRAEEEVVVFWFEGAWSEAELAYLRPQVDGFRSLAAYRQAGVTLRVGDGPARLIEGMAGSSELFRVLGRSAALGTTFRPEDDRTGAEPVAVLSHSLWKELGGRPGIVGERLELSGQPRTVIGVMPEGFWFPDPSVRVWLSEEIDPENRSGNYGMVARMPPGADPAAMEPQLGEITRLLGERFDYIEQWDPTLEPEITPVRRHMLGPLRPALFALLAATGALLLVASVNVSALMLGQVDARGTEIALRRALGAGHRRVVQQIVFEALLIGCFAGIAGAALAAVGFRFLVRVLPLGALAETASLDWSVFGAAMAVALLSATAVALAPGLSVPRGDLQTTLRTSRTGGVGGRGGRLEHALVVGQVALVLLLTAGAALLVRSVENFRSVDVGLEPEGVAILDLQVPATYDADSLPPLLAELASAVAAVPGVESAAVTQRLPLRGSSDNWGIVVEGRPDLDETSTAFRVVTPEYFRTLGIELVSGRHLLESDRDPDAASGAVVVNRALAEKYFPGVDPLGRRISFFSERTDRIVGVVEDVPEAALGDEPVPARYMVAEHIPFPMYGQTVVARVGAGLDPATVLDASRQVIHAVAPGVAVREVTTMETVLRRAIGPALPVMSLLVTLATLALVLGAVGIYGVVSHFVTKRRRDWGIKMILGMRPSDVSGRILGRGGALIGAGLAVGLVAFLLLARLLGSFLYGVGTTDPTALAAAAGVLLVAGLLAASVPARRAMRVDLAKVLRDE